MFPLPPNEAAVIAEIFRLFPGTREVTERDEVLTSIGGPDTRKGHPSLSVTSRQPPLFDNSREAA